MKYIKISDNEYQVIDTKEEIKTVRLDFIEEDIAHKEKLIANLQQGIADLQNEQAELIKLRDALLKVK